MPVPAPPALVRQATEEEEAEPMPNLRLPIDGYQMYYMGDDSNGEPIYVYCREGSFYDTAAVLSMD